MDTPICDFVRNYAAAGHLRLHMPGHKGVPLLGMEELDITEVEGADVLYHADGVIRRSQENAAALFSAARTFYSAEGSSLAIRAMLYLASLPGRTGGGRPRVAAGRNAHKAFLSAAALLDLEVDWLCSGEEGCLLTCPVTPEELERYLARGAEKPCAVYVTSPDYLGVEADIHGLARVSHAHGVPLLVDNAHGAYLHFLPQSRHPMALGADACCDSAHKTLPVLTGGAYLHIGRGAPEFFAQQGERALSLFASTSPSYLILQSLDAANRYLEGWGPKLADCARRVEELKDHLSARGFDLVGTEPLKLTVAPKSCGYTGGELSRYLAEGGMICEFADPDYTVMMFTPALGREAADRVRQALDDLPRKTAIGSAPPSIPKPAPVLSIRRAMLAPSEEVPVRQGLGRVLADAAVTCPPAVPIAVCGDRLGEEAVRCFEYYGIERCRVVSEE